jgi:hypothetical protein
VIARSTGPALGSFDGSCATPAFSASSPFQPLSKAPYYGPNADGEEASLERAGEGYVEVFELGVVKDPSVLAALRANVLDRKFPAPDCAAAFAVPLDGATGLAPPTGGLMGTGSIVMVGEGTLYSYAATALDDFSRAALWSAPGSGSPTLADANPKISRLLDGARYRESRWDVARGAHPADPVTAVLMVDQLRNGYVLDHGTLSGTDWVVTMPTKPLYAPAASSGAPARAPFQSTFAAGGAHELFYAAPFPCTVPAEGSVIYDRESRHMAGNLLCFGVRPPPQTMSLPWTANVLRFKSSFGSERPIFQGAPAVAFPVPTLSPSIENGWAGLTPWHESEAVHRLVSTDDPPLTYYGLPMIGFMVNNFANGTLIVGNQNVLSNYSATAPHRAIARIK